MKTLIALFALIATTLHAEAPKWADDVSRTILQAGREKKLTFILLGREACSNCQATRKLVNEGTVPVTADAFVIADIDVDNQKASAEFDKKFKKEAFGQVLPHVVITDSRGKVLSSYSGFKTAADLTAIVDGAKAKAAAVPGKK